MRKKLLDEVSVQELEQFRAEGYTNKEIAEMLEVSVNTINLYLGKMPPELRRKAKIQSWETRRANAGNAKPLQIDRIETLPKATAQPEPKPDPVEESPVYMLTTNEIITVASPARKYTLDRDSETVIIDSKEDDGTLKLHYEDIDTLIIELRMIRRKMGDSIKVGLVPW